MSPTSELDSRARLYLITPPAFEPEPFAPQLEAALAAGDVACLQLRLKDVSDEAVITAARTLLPIAQDYDVAFIVNDRPDIAAEVGADGVHIGQSDAAYDQARKLMGRDRIVGVTCHASRHLAMVAGEQGADYVAFGAFYPTATKKAEIRAEPEILTWWSELMEIPCVAIGGITVENAGPLIDAGADFLAVSAGVWNHVQGPAAAVRAFNALMDEALQHGDSN